MARTQKTAMLPRSTHFQRAYSKLGGVVRHRVDKTIDILHEDPRHPGLHTKRLQGPPTVGRAA
jgi:hypothetical protein